ncbi:MAG: DEAD/DEAH box helicase [Tannerellaceae bacterium]|nr:DEAD/DEAH box helicase [Tannerellaceae bacterium]
MTPYDLLSEPVRRYIRDKRWEELRPVQGAAITKVLSTANHFILASRTASGKTEAAFLPVLSCVDFSCPGVRVLYISPLIALINDQMVRVEELCKYLDVPVTKWHGEARVAARKQLLKSPAGIVLITPESLEAMFVNHPEYITHLFGDLQFVIIDEIHSFIGTDRGIQLKSILSRLRDINTDTFRILGLSATIGSYEEAKNFTGEPERTKVLLDSSARDMETTFAYFPLDNPSELPLDLIKELYRQTNGRKSLVFPNSRGRVEEISVKLGKLSARLGGATRYFSHHSSVDKEVREYVEYFAKNNRRDNFAIVCTSTLELGIDIGSVDQVIQIDATHTISSLIQRVGRSGRKDGAVSKLSLFATTPMTMLQSLACWNLYCHKYIEPPFSIQCPYDLLAHQAISIVKSTNGIGVQRLVQALKSNFAFSHLPENEIREIIDHLARTDIFEKIQHELIIGMEGEKIVNKRDFYSSFVREINLKVFHKSQAIGELQLNPLLEEDTNILLAARIWKIVEIDWKARKIYVVPAHDGQKPRFEGKSGAIHREICREMYRILLTDDTFEPLDPESVAVLSQLRKNYEPYRNLDFHHERPLVSTLKACYLHLFMGSRETEALQFLFQQVGLKQDINADCILTFGEDAAEIAEKWSMLPELYNSLDGLLADWLLQHPEGISFSKWGYLLPLSYQVRLLREKKFDFVGAAEILEGIGLVSV